MSCWTSNADVSSCPLALAIIWDICAILFSFNLLFVAIFIFALIGNLLAGSFNLGFENQPVAHQAHFWSFLGMMSVGLGSVMLGGCPLRQLILAGEGSSDSALSCLGMLLGAAFAHNFGLASSAGTGPSANGKIAAVAALLILFLIGLTLTLKGRRN